MDKNSYLKEFYKYDMFVFVLGFGGTVVGGMTIFYGIPIAFLSYLGASSTQIGMVAGIFWACFALPQIWAAYSTESLAIKKKYIATVLILSGIGFLAIGIYILLTGAVNKTLSIWLFLILYTWAAAVASLYFPANFSMLFKIIPSSRIGQLLGIIFAIQFGGLFFSGFAIKYINNAFATLVNYAVLFIITFFMTVFACLVMLSLEEPEGTYVKKAPSFAAFIGEIIDIFKTDKVFTKFVIGKWIMSGHYVLMAFLLKFLIEQRGFDPGNAGWFASLNGLGLFIGGFTITRIADVYGPKYMLVTSQIIAIVYTLAAWLVPTTGPAVVFIAFVITGFAQISDNVGYSSMGLFCCPTEDKSKYVAATNIGIIPFMIFLPIIIGKLMDRGVFSYNGTFTISVIMMIAAIIYILAVVEHPKSYIAMKAAAKK